MYWWPTFVLICCFHTISTKTSSPKFVFPLIRIPFVLNGIKTLQLFIYFVYILANYACMELPYFNSSHGKQLWSGCLKTAVNAEMDWNKKFWLISVSNLIKSYQNEFSLIAMDMFFIEIQGLILIFKIVIIIVLKKQLSITYDFNTIIQSNHYVVFHLKSWRNNYFKTLSLKFNGKKTKTFASIGGLSKSIGRWA